MAHGTLFLDEICEMDLDLQSKLLRFIQTGTYQKVGSSKLQESDIRFVCATNRDPLEEVKAGRFREDLYYRLHVIPIEQLEYKILFIDDDESIGIYYKNIFEKAGIHCHYEKKISNILNLVTDYKPDLLLIDINMPDCTGIELSQILRQRIDIEFIPIVYLSSESDPLTKIKLVSDGVDDFLDKATSPKYIINNLKSRIKRARNLRMIMMQDSLTNLYNHAMLKEQLELEVSRAYRLSTEVSFIMVDIDHFKYVNDKYGHMVGDMVIKSLSNFLKINLRKTDIVGRYGGEEFAIIMSDTKAQKAYQTIDKLRQQFSQIIHSSGSIKFSVTFSSGIASFPEYKNKNEIIKHADNYLYHAKENGRNNVVYN